MSPRDTWILDEETWPGPGQLSLRDPANLVNLSLDEDGGLRWVIQGGDYVGSGSATWSPDADAVRVTAVRGNETFPWTGNGTISSPAIEAVLVREDERHVIATITFADEVVEQRWETGYLCNDHCVGGGHLYSCELPFDALWDLVDGL